MRRILFVKTSSLGDIVHHCPAVSDAARRLPAAQIDWVVEEPFAEIAAMHRSVRRAIPVALRRWRRTPWSPAVWAEIANFRKALSRERYDTVIDSQGLLKSALICAFAPGTKHGMDRASAREPLAARFYDVTHGVPKGLHAVERNRRLTAAALGYEHEGPVSYGLRAQGASHGGDSSPYAVFLTLTSRADKLWPNERWVDLGRNLGMRIVLPWGSEAERARAETICAAIGRAGNAGKAGNASVPSRMPLGEIGALLANAKSVVGLDTGLTHLAAALGARTVGIYCGSDPALTGLHGLQAANVGRAGAPPSVAEVVKAMV
jgi:heptosyltransferase I